MKKMIVALILIVPLLFLLTVFSVAEVGSLNVQVPVSGIAIKNDLDAKTLYLDASDYKNDYKIEVAVYPMNAANKKFSFDVQAAESSEFADLEVSDEGVITARSLGSAKVIVKSFDGGYTDSMTVVVGSSRALDVIPSLYAGEYGAGENLLSFNGDSYSADLTTGVYYYGAGAYPSIGAETSARVIEGFALIDEARGTLSLPFGGKAAVEFSVSDGKGGEISRRVDLSIEKLANTSGILVNGNDLYTVTVDSANGKGECYIACDEEPVLTGADAVFIEDHAIEQVQTGGYRLTFKVAEGAPDSLAIGLSAGGKTQILNVSVGKFSYTLRTNLPVQTGENVTVVAGSELKVYAVTSAVADDVEFVWTLSGGGALKTSDGAVAEMDGFIAGDTFELTCEAYRDGELLASERVTGRVVNPVSGVSFGGAQGSGLAEQTAIAEYVYKDGKTVKNEYVFDFKVYSANGAANADDFDFTLSDDVATVGVSGGNIALKILSTGEVRLTATWKGAANYGNNVSASFTFTAVKNGVSVTDSDGFFAVTRAGSPVVIDADLMLGTDLKGNAYPIEKLNAMLGTTESTYNSEFLKNSGMETTVRYVAEFRNDVYGNGHSVNAEKFTMAADATGVPLLFKGALPLVGVYVDKSIAMKVSAQDNIAFLIRTDGITVRNVNLLGCSDEVITGDNGTDLSKLNTAGTVLDINADCRILNCRIKNGKTCVRVYGGNRSGGDFLRENLDDSDIDEKDRIEVEIDGCIISQAREFLVKTGANRALKSSIDNGNEPALLKADGSAYSPFEDLSGDDYFYDKYVLTDLTIRNSVLEKSGLFALGAEANFSGSVLNGDIVSGYDFAKNWGVGGTSFGAIVRLEGDVRFYDWKSVDNIDSSQLVEVFSGGIFDGFVLNIRKMIETVIEAANAEGNHSYDDIFTEGEDGNKYVNSAIVKYGGGRNYTTIVDSALDEEYRDFTDYIVNISVLQTSSDPDIKQQGEYLPLAAGTQDFVFSLYSSKSANSLQAQLKAYANGTAYNGIIAVR